MTDKMTGLSKLAREILGGDVLTIPEHWEEISEEGGYRLRRQGAQYIRSYTWSDWDENDCHQDGFYTGWVGDVAVYYLPIYGKYLLLLTEDYCGNCYDDRFIGWFLADDI